jgi:hypothetical protein
VVNVEKARSSQLLTHEIDEPKFHSSSKAQFKSFLYFFYTSILRYSVGVRLFYTADFRLWHPVWLYGAPLSEVGGIGGQRFRLFVGFFVQSYCVCKFLYFSARKLNFLHLVEISPDLLHSLAPEVNENVSDSIVNITTNR